MHFTAAGLQVLRDNNLIHRDLKPQVCFSCFCLVCQFCFKFVTILLCVSIHPPVPSKKMLVFAENCVFCLIFLAIEMNELELYG